MLLSFVFLCILFHSSCYFWMQVPPDAVEPLFKQIVNQFVHDRSRPEVFIWICLSFDIVLRIFLLWQEYSTLICWWVMLICLGYHCWNKCSQGDMPAYATGKYWNFLVLGHICILLIYVLTKYILRIQQGLVLTSRIELSWLKVLVLSWVWFLHVFLH